MSGGFELARTIALSFPEAVEADHHGSPSFRVRGKIFCTLRPSTARMMVKLDGEDQRNFCEAHSEAIEPVSGYWGRKGSTYVDCLAVGEDTIRTLLDLAWRGVAPKSLLRA